MSNQIISMHTVPDHKSNYDLLRLTEVWHHSWKQLSFKYLQSEAVTSSVYYADFATVFKYCVIMRSSELVEMHTGTNINKVKLKQVAEI